MVHLTWESKSHKKNQPPTSPGIIGMFHFVDSNVVRGRTSAVHLHHDLVIKHTHLNSVMSKLMSFKFQLQYSLNQEIFAPSVIISFGVSQTHNTYKYPIHCVLENSR